MNNTLNINNNTNENKKIVEVRKSNNLFISTALTISGFAVANLGLSTLIDNDTFLNFWSKNNQNFLTSEIKHSSLKTNHKLVAKTKESYLYKSYNFASPEFDINLDKMKRKLASDIEHYKNVNLMPFDTEYHLFLTPENIDKEFSKRNVLQKGINYFLSKKYPKFTYTSNISRIISSSIPYFSHNGSVTDIFKNYESNANCKINLVQKTDGSFINYDSLSNYYNGESSFSPEVSSFKTKYSEIESEMFQEFILLHEYYHCLHNRNYSSQAFLRLLGQYSNEEQKQLSSYLNGLVLYKQSDNNYMITLNLNSLTRNFEKLADIFAIVSLIHRYVDEKDEKKLSALNTVLSDMYSIRVASHLINPYSTHSGYEVFNYLTKLRTIEKIKSLNTAEEIEDFVFSVLEDANEWRIRLNPETLIMDTSLSETLVPMQKLIANIIQNEKTFNKEEIKQKIAFPEGDNLFKDIFDITIDYFLEYWSSKENFQRDIHSLNQRGFTDFSSYVSEKEHLYYLLSQDLTLPLAERTQKYHKIFNDHFKDFTPNKKGQKVVEDLLKLSTTKVNNLTKSYLNNLHNEENQEERKNNLVSKFGTYMFSYEKYITYSENIGYMPLITPFHSLILLKNFETDFYAYKLGLKRYSLDVPTDEMIQSIQNRVSEKSMIEYFDFETHPFTNIDKYLVRKIKQVQNNNDRIYVSKKINK